MTGKDKDIIAAIATAYGHGAIGIVRMSGEGVLNLLGRVFSPAQKLESHKMYYGKIYSNGEIIDEVMVCPMLAPRSYTKEDTVEIYAHGGMVVLRGVLDAVIHEGARLAEPGEFTKRAFLNGRINLTQAEAVMDLINAGSDAARRAGLRQLGGGLSRRIEILRDKILHWIAHIELSIDYPEHEEEAKNAMQILGEGSEVIAGLEALYKTAAVGRMLRDGIKTVIIGRPNAGKSTLLNAILSEDRAIVHEQAGTTRDILTERVVVGDVPLLLMDTAGIRETEDPVEKIGVEKTLEAAKESEFVLYVVDKLQGFDTEDMEMLQRLRGKPLIVLMNKCDLEPFSSFAPEESGEVIIIEISSQTGEGLDKLYAQIHELFLSGIGDANNDADIITRERHRILIEQAINYVRIAMQEIELGVPEDLVSVRLRAAYMALGEVLGVEVGDDILDRIFAEFCLGK
ncbi:MAG: tRNA uridine-5-carboxymethylaminomethyl(34) synthesis GTPase MnmE [Firmicutes bacterium]|nr:tRNA uridine-5-carboxymethylaminomethyl(34) synthesis GTPase MnmE [Bacillota bacterium]